MAHDKDSVLTNPGSPENARHVHDYEWFISLLKWGAALSLIAAFAALFIIS